MDKGQPRVDAANGNVVEGAKTFLRSYLGIEKGDRLLLVSAVHQRGLVELLADGVRSCGAECTLRSARCGFAEIEREIDDHDVVLYLEESSSTHRNEVLNYIESNGRGIRFYRAFDFSPELLGMCFRFPRSVLQNLNTALIKMGRETDKIYAS